MHHGGNPAELDKINPLASKYRISVVEDSAHALGAQIGKKKIGKFFDRLFFVCTTKNISTLGEGGMIVTNNKTFFKNAQG